MSHNPALKDKSNFLHFVSNITQRQSERTAVSPNLVHVTPMPALVTAVPLEVTFGLAGWSSFPEEGSSSYGPPNCIQFIKFKLPSVKKNSR